MLRNHFYAVDYIKKGVVCQGKSIGKSAALWESPEAMAASIPAVHRWNSPDDDIMDEDPLVYDIGSHPSLCLKILEIYPKMDRVTLDKDFPKGMV